MRREVVTSLRWSAVALIAVRAVSTIRGVLLARLLGPGPFGVFFAVAAVANMVLLGAEFGLGPFVIHGAQGARSRADVAATWAVATGLIGAALVAASARVTAGPYGPTAEPIALLLSGSVLLAPLSGVCLSLLRVELRFRRLALLQLVAEVTATISALVLAFWLKHPGAWPLVTSVLVGRAVTVGVAIVAVGRLHPRPSLLRAPMARDLLKFGLPICVGAMAWAVALQGDNVVVGRVLGATAVGIYGLAYNYGDLPSALLGNIVGQVAFPVFTHARDDAAELAAEFFRFTRLVALLVCPIVATATVVADLAVNLLLGHSWLAAVTPLRIFLIGGALRGLFPTLELLRAVGRVGVELRIGLVAAPAVLVAAYLGTRHGVPLVSVLVAIVFAGAVVANVSVAARATGVSALRVWLAPARVVSVSVIGSIALRALAQTLGLGDFAVIAFTGLGTAGLVLGAACAGLVPGWQDVRAIVARGSIESIDPELAADWPPTEDSMPLEP
jgi:PST family polysaccharide transporter